MMTVLKMTLVLCAALILLGSEGSQGATQSHGAGKPVDIDTITDWLVNHHEPEPLPPFFQGQQDPNSHHNVVSPRGETISSSNRPEMLGILGQLFKAAETPPIFPHFVPLPDENSDDKHQPQSSDSEHENLFPSHQEGVKTNQKKQNGNFNQRLTHTNSLSSDFPKEQVNTHPQPTSSNPKQVLNHIFAKPIPGSGNSHANGLTSSFIPDAPKFSGGFDNHMSDTKPHLPDGPSHSFSAPQSSSDHFVYSLMSAIDDLVSNPNVAPRQPLSLPPLHSVSVTRQQTVSGGPVLSQGHFWADLLSAIPPELTDDETHKSVSRSFTNSILDKESESLSGGSLGSVSDDSFEDDAAPILHSLFNEKADPAELPSLKSLLNDEQDSVSDASFEHEAAPFLDALFNGNPGKLPSLNSLLNDQLDSRSGSSINSVFGKRKDPISHSALNSDSAKNHLPVVGPAFHGFFHRNPQSVPPSSHNSFFHQKHESSQGPSLNSLSDRNHALLTNLVSGAPKGYRL